MKNIKKYILIAGASFLPIVSSAQDGAYCANWGNRVKTIADIFKFFTCLIQTSIIPIVMTLALLYFIYGVVNFFLAPDAGDKKREEGKKFMLWGIIGLFVMISVWGLVSILTSTFDTGGVTIPLLPTK